MTTNKLPFTRAQVDRMHNDFLQAAAKRAAAEDLLDAAKLALQELELALGLLDDLGHHGVRQAVIDLKKAIAKAEGVSDG